MEVYTIVKIALTIIGTLSVSSVAIWWFIQLGANTLADTYKKKIDHEFGKKLEDYKSQLEVLKATALKYNDRQFELYIDLWKNLQELKFAALDLWEDANSKNLEKFDVALKTAHRQIETTSILLEDAHYRDLVNVIAELREYDNGKMKLIAARRKSASPEEIASIIIFNGARKDECLRIIASMKAGIKQTIKGNPV